MPKTAAAERPPTSLLVSDEPGAVTAKPAREQGADIYAGFYRALATLRERLHSVGRFDDANAKLDELCKLFALRILDARHPIPGGGSRLSMQRLSERAERLTGSKGRLAIALHSVFDELQASFPAELQTLGPRPQLTVDREDDDFVAAVLPVILALPTAQALDTRNFDVLNEAFGHFVQESFRNRKDDAQYMTPPEAVRAMVEIAFADIAEDAPRADAGSLLIADPTCGVGSFLAAAYHHATANAAALPVHAQRPRLIGQDKVARMVRLSKTNLLIMSNARAEIFEGNTALRSPIDEYQGNVDLVLTNPPFGADFAAHEFLVKEDGRFPVLAAMANAGSLPARIASEYVMIDRAIGLLRNGGRLLVVVPDRVVSGGGFAARFRQALLRELDILGVIDLPADTFAQAGTRTKTSILYGKRTTHGASDARPPVVMATCANVGFTVNNRGGIAVKELNGPGDLPGIVAAFRLPKREMTEDLRVVTLSQRPSVAAVPFLSLQQGNWSATSFGHERIHAVAALAGMSGVDSVPLERLAVIDSDKSHRVLADAATRCISVLHVREDGTLDVRQMESYTPVTPCVRCQPGDVLLSRLNPQIPRVCVVPPMKWALGCSSEFAVLRARPELLTSWELWLLLTLPAVGKQMVSLASGTSSSHSRVKPADMDRLIVPIPRPENPLRAVLREAAAEAEQVFLHWYSAYGRLDDARTKLGVHFDR